jgi:hypothetical protein
VSIGSRSARACRFALLVRTRRVVGFDGVRTAVRTKRVRTGVRTGRGHRRVRLRGQATSGSGEWESIDGAAAPSGSGHIEIDDSKSKAFDVGDLQGGGSMAYEPSFERSVYEPAFVRVEVETLLLLIIEVRHIGIDTRLRGQDTSRSDE